VISAILRGLTTFFCAEIIVKTGFYGASSVSVFMSPKRAASLYL